MKNLYTDYQIQGWPAFVFKEKLKKLKGDLRNWSKDNCDLLEAKAVDLRNQLGDLYRKLEEKSISEGELFLRGEIIGEIKKLNHY